MEVTQFLKDRIRAKAHVYFDFFMVNNPQTQNEMRKRIGQGAALTLSDEGKRQNKDCARKVQ